MLNTVLKLDPLEYFLDWGTFPERLKEEILKRLDKETPETDLTRGYFAGVCYTLKEVGLITKGQCMDAISLNSACKER